MDGVNYFNLEAEKSVIGAMLLSGDCVSTVIGLVRPDDFYDPRNKELFEAILDIFNANKPLDVVILVNQLNSRGTFGKVGGEVYIVKVANAVPTTANVKHYCGIIKTAATRRSALEAATEVIRALNSGNDLTQIQTNAAKLTDSLAGNDTGEDYTLKQYYYDFLATKDKKREYISTGIPKIDRNVRISKGDFVIVGGRPSTGKTALTLQMAKFMAKTRKVLYVSIETAWKNVGDRIMAESSGVVFDHIQTRGDTLTAEDLQKIKTQESYFLNSDFIITKPKSVTVPAVKSKVLKYGAELVFIDYVGLMDSEGRSLYEKNTALSKALHIMAQELEITVIALCQLNRDGKEGKPNMANLRESGQFEQDADTILLLYNIDPENPDNRGYNKGLVVAKQKQWKTGNLLLHFEGKRQKFYDITNGVSLNKEGLL
jgi:replicative DNA helicase